MRVTIRAKLTVIIAAAGLTLVVLVVATNVITRRLEAEIETIQGRYLPKMELRPRLEADFERARRGFQDAVAARDAEVLAEARGRERVMLDELAAGHAFLEPAAAAALRPALEAYFASAGDVSRRLLGGETGEGIVDAMADMQAKQATASDRLKLTTRLEEGELRQAFATIARTQTVVGRVRLALSAACLALVISLAIWLGRGVLRSLGAVDEGLRRFAKGDFARPIEGMARDELGDVATQANQMAESLRRLLAERDRRGWLAAGHADLARELRGQLEPEEVATRAVRVLSRLLEAPAAALYVADDEGAYRFAAGHARVADDGDAPQFRPGEGLVGQAALQEEVTVVAEPPADYLRIRSGLGEGAPRALVLQPLPHGDRVVGVLELALWKPWTEDDAELLVSVRETLAIAIVVARARAAMRDLLAATQRQAERLTTQEEELRATNEELQAQEEELRQANTDLSLQTTELEAQRGVLAERNVELDAARVGLERRAAELATVSAYKSQFLANMSHELRTPLNSMLLLSNLLAENEGGTLGSREVEFARTIFAAGKDLLALINQVLDLAKVESGREEVELGAVRLDDVVERARRVFEPLARDKGLAFTATLARDAPEEITTDRRRLEQILTNLLGNAVKFTARGEVALRIERAPADTRLRRADLAPRDAVAFVVSDTGLGIAAEDHERVFAPFEQVDGAADRRYGGTGLGLGIARELATLLGGELQLRSALGAGSTFTCFVPRSARGRVSVAREEVAAPTPAPAPSRPTEPFLLLIEDDAIFATTFGEVIGKQGTAHVRASTGQEGLRLARELHPRGIILDVRLPDMDGWRVMERLRADPDTAGIPVHFVSALDAAERGLAMGAVGYVRKPVTRRDLLRVVDALVPRVADVPARFLVVEDDEPTADSVLRMLEAEHLEVRRASTAAEALDVLARERFACLILDLSLPDMSGLELLRALREGDRGEPPKVVVYTARSLSRDETVTLEAYAEAIVLKDGSSVERLLDEVRLFVRRFQAGGAARAPEPARPDARFAGRRALVVDDDMRTVYALSATLRGKGLDVVVADTGKAALDALDAHPDVDVVLMDIMMPEMDGYEAMRHIRADPRFAALPIIALTAKAMKGDEETCIAAGASHYLPKPVDAERLVALLVTCLGDETEARARA